MSHKYNIEYFKKVNYGLKIHINCNVATMQKND